MCGQSRPIKVFRPGTCVKSMAIEGTGNIASEIPLGANSNTDIDADIISGQTENSLISNDVNSESCAVMVENENNNYSILISASEVQRAQGIVSSLRHKHRMNVVTSKPGIDVGASFMLSPRCSVLRISTQEFCNAMNR